MKIKNVIESISGNISFNEKQVPENSVFITFSINVLIMVVIKNIPKK